MGVLWTEQEPTPFPFNFIPPVVRAADALAVVRRGPAVAVGAAAVVGAGAVALAGLAARQRELGAAPTVRAHVTEHLHRPVVDASVAITVLLKWKYNSRLI